jgi:hypothetical protein
MRAAAIEAYPWVEDFIQVECVASGRCAFPNYGPKSCPVWFEALDGSKAQAVAKGRFWAIRHEANPVAAGGKAK